MQRAIEAAVAVNMPTGLRLRAFTEQDYPDFAALHRCVYPTMAKSETELRYADTRFQLPYKHSRWLALRDEHFVGWVEYAQHAAFDPPGQFALELGALPYFDMLTPWLYEMLCDQVQLHKPHALRTEVDDADAQFYRERGFREVKKNVSLRLELSSFSETRYRERLGHFTKQGYSFVTFAELERTDAGLNALYKLLREIVADVPSVVPRTPWSFEQFLVHRRKSPVLLPEASVVVRQGQMLVGVSELKRTNEGGQLMTSLTGVKRESRGLGLALAAKVRALTFARERGFTEVVTQNASSNSRMLSLNEHLGFQAFRMRTELLKTL